MKEGIGHTMNEAAWFVYNMVRIGSVKSGEYTLKSGKKSNIYVDMRNIMSTPRLYDDMFNIIDRLPVVFDDIDVICGVPLGGIPFATFLSYKKSIPMIMLRDKVKTYGLGRQIEGTCYKDDRVLLIEDVVSTGASAKESIDILRAHGLNVSKCLVLVSRDDAAVANLGIPDTHIVFHLDFVQYMLDCSVNNELFMYNNSVANAMLNMMLWKKTNIILSCDLCSAKEIKQLVNHMHPDILAIKLHSDIITDFDESFMSWLRDIRKSHNLFVIEDRKLSDIGAICKKQLNGLCKISSWANAVTAHSICGKGTFEAIKECKLAIIPVTELSAEGNLIDGQYTSQTMAMLTEYRTHIAGIVTQKGGRNKGYLTMTPGLTLEENKTTDGQGQTYKVPSADSGLLWIIGRSLYEHPEYIQAYREAGMRHAAEWGL